MKSKSNPKGIRKGHWVSKPHWENAYKVNRVENGLAFIILNGKEFEINYPLKDCHYLDELLRINPLKTNKNLHP